MRNRVVDTQAGFGGGLNTVADESQLEPNQFRQGVNVRLTEANAARKRFGTRRLHSSALAGGSTVRGGYSWNRPTGAIQLAVAGGNLYHGTLSYGMIWTAVPGVLDATVYPSFAAFREADLDDVVYIADGGLLNKWSAADGFTANLVNTPAVTQICVFNRRLFGVTGTDEKLYWSALDNGDTLGVVASKGGVARVLTFGDQRLTAVAPFRASLFLFHVSGISKFTGWSQDDINIQAGTTGVTGDVGTIAPRSIVVLENGVLFLSDRGIYVAAEEGVAPVSANIDVDFSNLTATQLAQVCAAHNRSKREVWFFIPGKGVYVYNYRTQTWTGPWTGTYSAEATDTHALWEAIDADEKPIVLCGDVAGYVKRTDVQGIYTDDVAADGTGGTPYTMVLRCHRMFSGSIASEKSYRWAYVLADVDSSEACTIGWTTFTTNGAYTLGGSSAWGTGTWGAGVWGGEGVIPFRIPIHGRGGYADITITDAGNRSPLFSRVEIEAFDMGRRGS